MNDSPPDPHDRRQAAGEPDEPSRPVHEATADEPSRPVPEATVDGPGDGVRLEVSGTQVAASVLASVSAAVVASFFGVAGTIIGAGVVSVVATIGSAAYSLGIRRTKHRLHKLQTLRTTRPLPSVRTEDGAPRPAVPRATEPEPVGTAETGDGDAGWRGWLAERRWGVAAGVALVFVISLASVTLLELVGDRTLGQESSGSARTSIGALLFGDGGSDDGTGGGTDDTVDEVDDGGGGDDPASPSTTVPADATTTSQPGGTTSTTAVEPGTGTREPPAPTTSTTPPPSTTSTTAPSVATTTTAPDGQAAPPPADLGGAVTPMG